MLVKHYSDVPAQPAGEGAECTTVRWLIAEPEGAPTFYMRLFEIGPKGCSPHHAHDWEHEVYILDGEGGLVGENESYPLRPGDAVLVPGGEIHHFESAGGKIMKMLCLIPKK